VPVSFIEIKIPGIENGKIRSFQVVPVNKSGPYSASNQKSQLTTGERSFIGGRKYDGSVNYDELSSLVVFFYFLMDRVAHLVNKFGNAYAFSPADFGELPLRDTY
jgi:hypothetical protein